MTEGEASYPSESDFITKFPKSANAELGITDIEVLGKAEPARTLALVVGVEMVNTYPLQASVAVSMMALEVSTLPKRVA